MTNVTQILAAMEQGDPRAAESLLPLVYAELRRLAASKLRMRNPGRRCRPRPWYMKPTCVWSEATPIVAGTVAATSLPRLPRPCVAS